MASFDRHSNYNENTSFSSIVFGAEKPVLEVELNELQQILNTKFSRLLKGFRSGLIPLSDDSIAFDASSRNLTIKDCILLENNLGLTAYVQSVSVTMNTTSKRTAFFEIQEVEVNSVSELKSYGNTTGEIVTNTMIDDRVSAETSRRKIVTYTLKVSPNVPADTDTTKHVFVGSYTNSIFTSVKWGLEDPEFTGSVSMGRKSDTTVGTNSVALGIESTASGKYSFAHGENVVASGIRSFASGLNAKATGKYSQAFGNGCEAQGNSSHAEGYNTIALHNQHSQGHHNDNSVALASDSSGVGDYSGTKIGTSFVIGNGTNSVKSNAFRIQSDGTVYAKGVYNSTGIGYSEYLEWADGNTDGEDRRGYFVTFDESEPTKIRKSKADDVYVIGVVSGNPSIIGNSDESWLGKFLFDEFNTPIYETIEEREKDDSGNTLIHRVRQQKVNPDFDSTQEYKHRNERPEWSAVGLIGMLSVRDDGTCTAGGYCTWGEGGIAKTAEASNTNYRVLERVNENIIRILVK